MLTHCPFCGHNLPRPIIHGIAGCNNCFRVFESSPFNRILSVAWLIRRQHITDRDVLIQQYGYDPVVVDLLMEFVVDEGRTHEEFVDVLKRLNISEEYESRLDVAS